ncbi:hypothetical protein KVC03_00450 [Helicobacter pylori]|nr:hypothetical protein KVC03_00450 [Helicobacter pylori]
MRIVSKSVRFLARMGFKISKKFLPHKIKRYIISLTLEYIKKRYSSLFYKDFVAAISHGHYPSFLSDMISNNPNPQALEVFYENLFQIMDKNSLRHNISQIIIEHDFLSHIISHLDPKSLEIFYENLFQIMDKNSLRHNISQIIIEHDFLSHIISHLDPKSLEIFYENLFQMINDRIKQSKEEALAFAAHVIQILTSAKSLNNIESDYTENTTLMGVKLSTIESLLPKGLGLYNIKVCLTNFGDYRFNKIQKLNFLIHNLLFLQNLKVKDPITSLPTTLLKAKTITFHRAETGGGIPLQPHMRSTILV